MIEPSTLDRTRRKHGVLPATGRCYACNCRLKYIAHTKPSRSSSLYYCSVRCMRVRPPKLVLAELAWGRPFREMALDHLNGGGTIQALADLCGVHRQAVMQWLRIYGIRKQVVWVTGA